MKVQRGLGSESCWVADHMEGWDSGAPGSFVPLPTFLASVVIISFYNTLVNSKERVFLGSVSCSSKLTKHQEGVPRASDWSEAQVIAWT